MNYKKLVNVDSDPIIHSQKTTAKEISRDAQKIICKRIHGTFFLLEKIYSVEELNCILVNSYIAVLCDQHKCIILTLKETFIR